MFRGEEKAAVAWKMRLSWSASYHKLIGGKKVNVIISKTVGLELHDEINITWIFFSLIYELI